MGRAYVRFINGQWPFMIISWQPQDNIQTQDFDHFTGCRVWGVGKQERTTSYNSLARIFSITTFSTRSKGPIMSLGARTRHRLA